MTHANHPTLPGYDERQLFHDGCEECEARGASPEAATYLDRGRFAKAWKRAADWQRNADPDVVRSLSHAELPMLRSLWYVQVMFERCYGWPLGTLPLDVTGATLEP